MSKALLRRYMVDYGIELDKDLLYNTFSPEEWYDFFIEEKIPRIPNLISKHNDSWIRILRYVAIEKHGMRDRENILKIDRKFLSANRLTTIRTKLSQKMHEIITICFPEYSIEPWERAWSGTDYFKDVENQEKAIDWFMNKHDYTVKDILSHEGGLYEQFVEDGLVSLIKKDYFGGVSELFEWYFKRKGIHYSVHDSYIKHYGYWIDINNFKIQIDRYIKYLIKYNLIPNPKDDIPYYFSYDVIEYMGYAGILKANQTYRHTDNLFLLLNELYPEYSINMSKKVITGVDSMTKLDSLEEKRVFDYIYLDLGIKEISTIEHNRKKEFFNKEYQECYVPDFLIEGLKDKPIIIEYFGMTQKNLEGKHYMFVDYAKKTVRKNAYFREREDIYYVDIYPEDLKDKMINIKDKLSELIPSLAENKEKLNLM